MSARGICILLAGVLLWCGVALGEPSAEPSRLCVVWSSADPEVAKNVCLMYTLNAKKMKWFDVVHLLVWGPSAKLLAEDQALQAEVKGMRELGVVAEACIVCAQRYGVDDDLQALGLDVRKMGQPLSDRLKGDWKVITF